MLAIVGPTASGKTALALEVAPEIGAEIVSIDSAAAYRGMNIGTAKPTESERRAVAHHMVDIAEPSGTLTVQEFQRLARAAISEIQAKGRIPLLVGGSGLYFRAVVDPLEFPETDPEVRRRIDLEAAEAGPEVMYARLREIDPEAASRIQQENVRRTVRALEVIEITGRPFSSFRTAWDEYRSIYDLRIAGLAVPRPNLDAAIDARVDEMLAAGLVEEVRSLLAKGLRESITPARALGYAQILDYLDGRLSLEDAVAEIKRRTRKFARRQMMWFRADPRVVWFESNPQGARGFLVEGAKGGG